MKTSVCDWITIDKTRFQAKAIGFCTYALLIIRDLNAFLFASVGLSTTVSALGFAFRYLKTDFNELPTEAQTQILVELQQSVIPKIVIVLIILFVIQLCVELYLKHVKQSITIKLKKLEKKNSQLTAKLSKYNFFSHGIGSFIKMYFYTIAKKCKLTDQERLSFYIREKSNGKVLAISNRYSSNPDYQSIIRETYSTSQGIIRLAARKGSALIEHLPDYETQSHDYYAKCSSCFNMSKSAVDALSMKASFYYAFRFSSHDNQSYNSMVVLESMNPTFSTKENLDAIFSLDNEFVYCLVDTFKEQMPKLKISKKGKF